MPIRTVNPGDLITALDWNDLINLVNAMDVRIAELESSTGGNLPRIIQVLPSGPITAGDTIRIFGSNFDFSEGAHSVFFGVTRAISFLDGSSDTLLLVRVPDPVEGATEAGAPMTLIVGNLVGTTTQAITVRSRPVVTSGGLNFTFIGTRPTETPTANSQFFYDFQLTSTASEDLTVTIAPTIAVIPPLPDGVPDPGLPARLAVIDSGTVRENGQVFLAEGTTRTVSLRLSLPAGTNGVRYSLSATASAPGVATRTEILPEQQVGVAGETPDPTITNFDFNSVAEGDAAFFPTTGGVSGVDGTIRVRQNTTATIEFGALFANIPSGTTNNYLISATIDSPAGGWSAAVNDINQNPLPVVGPGGPVTIFFDINAPFSATTAIMRLTLTRQGLDTNNRRVVAYRVQHLTTPIDL
jgi:hypothetical protein